MMSTLAATVAGADDPRTAMKPRSLPDLAMIQARAGEASSLLKALANAQRLRVLCLLVDQELTVSQINARLPGLSQSALSQHLAKLRAEGMVETRRESQQIWYRLGDGPVHRLIGTLHDIYCRNHDRPSKPRRGTAATKAKKNAGVEY